ncbi:MAG: hypothetical protein ACSW8C_00645 [bacterium]
MEKKIAYLLFGVGTFLGNVFYLEGAEVDSAYRWEQCKKIITHGKIRRDALVEILLWVGADPNGNIEDWEKLPIQYPIEHSEPEEGKTISGIESTIGALLVEYGADVSDDLLKQKEELSAFGLPLILGEWLEKNEEKLKQDYEDSTEKTGEKSLTFSEWAEKAYESYSQKYILGYNALYNPAKEAISRAKKNGQKIVNRAKITNRTYEKASLTKDLCEILGLEDEEIDEEKDEISLKNKDRISLTKILYKILELEDEEIHLKKFPDFSKEELFELLLDDPKLDINRKDSKGLTLLQYARKGWEKNEEIIEILEKHGATDP